MFAALVRLPLFLAAPLVCHLRGHHWHLFHAVTTIRVCDWCGFIVDDPYREGPA